MLTSYCFDSFATLLYVKILSVSTDLMVFTSVHELNSEESHYRLYYAGNVKPFQSDHVPYIHFNTDIDVLCVCSSGNCFNLQPYKHSLAHYTTIDVSFLVLLSLIHVLQKEMGWKAFNEDECYDEA